MRGSSHRPVPSSCTRLKFDAGGRERAHHLRHRVGAVGNEDAVDAGRRPAPRAAPARRSGSDRRGYFSSANDASAAARHLLLERGLAPPCHRRCPAAARRTSACRARRRNRRCGRRRSPAGSSTDRRRARRRWRRSRTRSPGCCAGARPAPTALTACANSGPMMISAPSSIACCAAACALCGLPPSSFTSSWMFGFLNSASAISAAFFIDCAATPALPGADSGRISADADLAGADGRGRLRSAGCGGGASVVPRLPSVRCWCRPPARRPRQATPPRRQADRARVRISAPRSTCRRLPAIAARVGGSSALSPNA